MKIVKQYILGIDHITILNIDKPPFRKHDIEQLLELTEEEFNQFRAANTNFVFFEEQGELFKLALLNLQDFYDCLYNCKIRFIQASPDFSAKQAYFDINRRFLNLLSSVKTYLDHTETNFNHRYGSNSQNLQKFKRYTNEEYDNHLAYRFLYELRNYAQHCGLPLQNINFNVSPDQNDVSKPIHKITVNVERDKFLADFGSKLKLKLKHEFANFPSQIEINSYLSEYMECINNIARGVIQDEFELLRTSAEYIHQLLIRTGQPNENIRLFVYTFEIDEAGKPKPVGFNVIPIPFLIVEAVLAGDITKVSGKIEIATF